MNTRSSTLMAAAKSLAIAKHAAPAFAREAAEKSGADIETVVVPGICPGLAESPETKRESQTVIDVLASEDVGKFPDENVAEALQRVSGVSISREFGEGERVSIRDAAPNLTRTSLRGHTIGTPDGFVVDPLAARRSFNHRMLPI